MRGREASVKLHPDGGGRVKRVIGCLKDRHAAVKLIYFPGNKVSHTAKILTFFGGGKLVERFEKFGFNYNMFHFIDYGHEVAVSMESTMNIQREFLEKNVMQRKERIIEAWISDPDVYKGGGPQSRKDMYGK